MTILDVSATRLERLLDHLKHSPDVLKLNEVLSGPAQDTIDVCEYILTYLNIDDAEGVMLDFLGSWIGVVRPKAQEDPDNIFTLCAGGETDDLDGSTGFFDDSDPDVDIGGYFTSIEGLESITSPGSDITDVDYRFLIRQKAATFRTRMTRENLWEYLYISGARCRIDDDTPKIVTSEPATFYDFNEWTQNYIETKGFKPGGISVTIKENMKDKDSI